MKKRWVVGAFAVGFAAFFAACDDGAPIVEGLDLYEIGEETDLSSESYGPGNSSGSGQIPESISDIVFAVPPASFCFVNVDTISAGDSATWYYESRSGKEETFSWVFPEGPDSTSAEKSPTITYPYGGQYSGKVIVTFKDGSKGVEIVCANVANVIGEPAPSVFSSSTDSTMSSSSEGESSESSEGLTRSSSSEEAGASSSSEESVTSSSGEGGSSASGDESSASESSSSSVETDESSSSSEEATSSDASSSSSEEVSSSSVKPAESSSSKEPEVSSSSEEPVQSSSSSEEPVRSSSSEEPAQSSSSEAVSSSSEEVSSSSVVESSSSEESSSSVEESSSSEVQQDESSSSFNPREVVESNDAYIKYADGTIALQVTGCGSSYPAEMEFEKETTFNIEGYCTNSGWQASPKLQCFGKGITIEYGGQTWSNVGDNRGDVTTSALGKFSVADGYQVFYEGITLTADGSVKCKLSN